MVTTTMMTTTADEGGVDNHNVPVAECEAGRDDGRGRHIGQTTTTTTTTIGEARDIARHHVASWRVSVIDRSGSRVNCPRRIRGRFRPRGDSEDDEEKSHNPSGKIWKKTGENGRGENWVRSPNLGQFSTSGERRNVAITICHYYSQFLQVQILITIFAI
jgi:hypothetical protein